MKWIVCCLFLLVGCNQDIKRPTARRKNLEQAAKMAASGKTQMAQAKFSGVVLETMAASKYTYVLLDTGKNKVWLAGPKIKVMVGDKLSASEGMEMNNFTSKTLKKTFEKIYFIPKWLVTGNKVAQSGHAANEHTKVNTQIFVKTIKHHRDEIAIGKIYEHKSQYKGKKVRVRGTVVKFLTQIMGKNWIHLQDGSSEKYPDLTITTTESVKVGDVVKLEGIITTEKDFGFGYFYPVIMENAVLIK